MKENFDAATAIKWPEFLFFISRQIYLITRHPSWVELIDLTWQFKPGYTGQMGFEPLLGRQALSTAVDWQRWLNAGPMRSEYFFLKCSWLVAGNVLLAEQCFLNDGPTFSKPRQRWRNVGSMRSAGQLLSPICGFIGIQGTCNSGHFDGFESKNRCIFLDLKVQKVPILNEWKIPHLPPVCSHAIDTKSINNFYIDKIMELESLNWRIRSKNRNAEISNNKDTMSAAITH